MKTCDICGEEFQESRKNQKYCKTCGKDPKRARKRLARAVYVNKIHAGDLHKPKEITCLECGKKILTTYNRGFCSTACSEMHRRRTATCPVCGKSLMDSGNDTGRGFCSDVCKEKQQLRRAIKNGDYIPCEYCGKKFIRKGYSNRFCSRDCFNQWVDKKKKNMVVAPVTKWEEIRNCEYCGKPFTVTREIMGKKYCSVDCRKEKLKRDKIKSTEKLNLGKELHICTVCKTSQMDCERFTSNFVYSPKGSKGKIINNKWIIVSCPKFKGDEYPEFGSEEQK